MSMFLKATALSLGLAAAATAAQAAVLDFTDPTTFSVAGDTITGAGFDAMTATGGSFNISEAGPGPVGPLAGTIDGVGIGDDEISIRRESVTLSFANEVTLTAIYLLDFFSGEQMTISNGTDTVAFLATAVDTVGFFTGSLGLAGTVFTISPGNGNDGLGVGDFALAGVAFDGDAVPIIPLPAGALLLGAALVGLGVARRRKPSTGA